MATETLKRPVAKKLAAAVAPKPPRCVTPWSSSRPWPVIAFPKRERVQEVVTADERETAASLLAAYREAEQEVRDNDLGARAMEIRTLEATPTITGEAALRIEELRQEMANANHQTFLVAQAEIRELEEDAAELVKPILERCVESFDAQLNQLSLEREAALDMMGIPLYQETRAHTVMRILMTANQLEINEPTKVWELHQNKELVYLHSMREVVRHMRTLFDGEYNRAGALMCTVRETLHNRAIPTLIHFCTNEPCEYSWL